MTKLSLRKPTIAPIFGRVVVLLFVLLLASFVAITAFSNGISWFYDVGRNYSPLLACPSFILNAALVYPNGPVCRMALSYSSSLATSIDQAGLLNSQATSKNMGQCSLSSNKFPEYIDCYWDASCDSLCATESTGDRCPGPDGLTNPSTATGSVPQCLVVVGSLGVLTMPCYYVTVDSYCDNVFMVTPSNEIAIRGILIASIVITLIWLISEFVLRSVEIDLLRDSSEGKIEQDKSLGSKIAALRSMVNERWAAEAAAPTDDLDYFEGSSVRDDQSMVTLSPMARFAVPLRQYDGHSNFSSPVQSPSFGKRRLAGINSRDPRVRFGSTVWKRRLRQYKTLRTDMKTEFKSLDVFRSVFLDFVYFCLIVGTLYIVVLLSPQHIGGNGGSLWNVLEGQVSLWRIHSVLDIIVFADILLDFGLFVIAAVFVQWPISPVFSRHLQNKLDAYCRALEEGGRSLPQNTQNREDQDSVISVNSSVFDRPSEYSIGTSSQDTRSISFVLKQSVAFDCCLMIACHESTMTAEKSKSFTNTLKAALMIFPPSHVFICDNGNAISPSDDTQLVAQSVHPDINYLYVPEGNKTFAFYWCNKYWIPNLVRCGVVETNFTYALIIDDDVPLPSDLHIPHEHLRQHTEIKAVHFPITATTPNGRPPLLVNCQDIEYKLAAVHKQFQSQMSRALSCHGAVALWERKAMEDVLYMHDTVFHGEDMYMGLCLLRKRDDSRIISAAQSIVPTYAPDTFKVLFRQRVKSWELTSHRKTLTYLFEFLSPRSFCHVPSLILKPYFLQELITILLDWLRVYLLCGLLLRDWLGLITMTVLFASLMYIQVFMFTFMVLRNRRDLRPKVSTFLMFPLYRFCGLLFRICALCHNLLVYSHRRSGMKIGKREDEIHDIPPTPPSHIVDWFTVWDTEFKLLKETTV